MATRESRSGKAAEAAASAGRSSDARAEGDERFEALMTRLEGLVTRLEKGELPLEDSITAYEEGMRLVQRAKQKLDVMDRRLEQLQQDGSLAPLEGGSMRAVPGERAAPPEPPPADPGFYDDDLPF